MAGGLAHRTSQQQHGQLALHRMISSHARTRLKAMMARISNSTSNALSCSCGSGVVQL